MRDAGRLNKVLRRTFPGLAMSPVAILGAMTTDRFGGTFPRQRVSLTGRKRVRATSTFDRTAGGLLPPAAGQLAVDAWC